ncbi:nitronate monooxygenase [Ruegeria pomeroyi]|uniref:Oxidoreductase, 2-nitropropane dioxygenase family n=2 Tax=Ruegeria pomeroyi TaxID=89184 RepID=Q5LVW5_RUEPO|nr:nitronate monooxygenase [Ruegeria pomeroyi]AAV93895.1 oxidoreductase, 2-nitropropane dioxygenase family [Ruegeria pomeroyi DSS-3]NVK95448.1 nitronate monooxygenase [Ruegeria pomeroyi]NVL02976.1 nitronate monooxygenase [Ruegeria pomeroyi]QWV07483.1 nitronate monooxygenase [Ruegeria pomeroyi]
MNSDLCRKLGIEFPLFAFSHCRDVVAAVSRAGGMGVFGAVLYTPEQLRTELEWIDANCGGKPYGVDLIVPTSIQRQGGSGPSDDQLLAGLPAEHLAFAEQVLERAGVGADDLEERRCALLHISRNLDSAGAEAMLDVAFSFPIRLIANALGTPPQIMLDRARAAGVPVAALVGSKQHAQRQVAAGVDILVAAGGEAGGHCGEVSTMVLVPEVVSVAGDTPVLAAGGIVTGRQMAAAMAMGAAGAWCGSVWLTTAEGEPSQVVKDKMLAASSSDTVRSRSRTGKTSRQLKSAWTDAWEADGPAPLPMPLQSLVAEPALARIEALAQRGHAGAADLATYWVGQGVGLMTQTTSAAEVVQDFKRDYLAATERLMATLED